MAEKGESAGAASRSVLPRGELPSGHLLMSMVWCVDYPRAERGAEFDELHEVIVPDPYRWLENGTSTETKVWVDAQTRLLDAERETWSTRGHWASRLPELLGAGFTGAPTWRGGRQFFMQRTPDAEQAVLVLREPDESERVLIDPQALDPSGLTTLDSLGLSKEGDRLAYQLSHGGTEESELYVMDVDTGETIEGPIDRCRYSPIAWLPGGEQFYYVRRLDPAGLPEDEQQFHRRVWLHTVGRPTEEDVLVFGEGRLMTEYYGVSVSRDGRWLEITASEGTAPRNDLWVADLGSSPLEAPALVCLQEGVDAETHISFERDGRWFVYTDRDAPRGKLLVADMDDPFDASRWSELISENPEAVLNDVAVLDRHDGPSVLLASWTRHAISELTLHDAATGARTGEVDLPGIGSIGALVEHPDGGERAWFVYSDHTTVLSVYRYDVDAPKIELYASPPGTVDVPDVHSQVIEYQSTDGTTVRMFVISHDGDLNRPRPTILYGYGGFGSSMGPAYSATILSWVEAGGVYAIACIRGGGEEGEDWHRAGMLGNKQQVFDDFVAAAEWLLDNGVTTREKLAISGGSNGGLLVGAVMVQRPELFAAVNCSAPLLDMVRYEKFGLGATWNVEYGSASVAEEFDWLHSYSPYHHVHDGTAYPAAMFTVFDGDTRVDPLHARKMVAELQHATSSARPILLRAEADVGHGARTVTRSVELSADVLAFTAAHTGLSLGDDGDE